MKSRAGALLVLGLVGWSCDVVPDPEIRIGILSYITGERRETSGRGTSEAAFLAQRLLDRAGGLRVGSRRYRIRLIIRDIGDRADLATSEARRLINEDGVVALIGPQFSRDAIPVASLAEQAGVPMISPMSSHPATTAGKRFVFRIAYVDDLQGGAMARFARETLGARRAALLYDVAGDYNRNLAEVFRREFESRGGEIVAAETFTSDASRDFAPQLRRIRSARPEVIFSPNFIGAVSTQLVQARRLGIDATFLGTDSWDPEILAPLAEARGSYVTSQWHRRGGTPQAERFIEQYRQAYGREPLATAAATFDALQLLFVALGRSGSLESHTIRDRLAAIHDYPGVTGLLCFEHGGDPHKSAFIIRIAGSGGEFVTRIGPR